MAEDLKISKSERKEEKYKMLVPQIENLIKDEKDSVANLGNTAAAIHETFGFLWTGFYLVKKDDLVLGPFQGPVACTRMRRGKGVCGKAWEDKATIVVPDVNEFPGHIACSSLSNSEIVVPLFKGNEVVAILDIDSINKSQFDNTDKHYLEIIANLVSQHISFG